jgi:glycosyltransferase involved in cell wall biosynthesis
MFGCDRIAYVKDGLLSICIPTYNHAEPLRNCLEALIPQAKEHNTPIYVSDNASTDNTRDVFESFKKDYPFMYYKRNNKNLGVDQNMIEAALMASTKYVWPFGARRIILPEMLNKIYKILERSDLDLLVLNDQNSTFLVPESRCYNSAQEVFRELNRNLTGLGFQVFPLDAWKSESLKKYAGTEWTVFGASLEFLATKQKVNVYFVSEPVSTSSGISHWIPRCFQIWTNWKKTLKMLPEVYSDTDKEFILRKSVNYFFGGPNFDLINLRTRNIYNAKIFRDYRDDLTHYGNYSPNIAYVISRLPTLPLKLYFKIYDAARDVARLFIHQKKALNPTRRQAIPYI